MSSESVMIDREDLVELKKLYEKSLTGEVFLFKGKEVLKEYAKYLIEYLDCSFYKEDV